MFELACFGIALGRLMTSALGRGRGWGAGGRHFFGPAIPETILRSTEMVDGFCCTDHLLEAGARIICFFPRRVAAQKRVFAGGPKYFSKKKVACTARLGRMGSRGAGGGGTCHAAAEQADGCVGRTSLFGRLWRPWHR
jgi:hypothetical protein